MRILLISLLVFMGLNQALARSLPWLSHTLDAHDAWLDDDYDLFHLPSNQPNDDFYKFMTFDDSSEESKELEKPVERNHQDGLFNVLLNSFLVFDDIDTNDKESTQHISNEKRENDDDNDTDTDDEKKNILNIILDDIAGDDELQSSEEKNNFKWHEGESSGDIKTLSREDRDEVEPNMEVDIFDLGKSSEETKDENSAEARSLEENSNETTETTDMIKSSQEQTTDVFNDLSDWGVNYLASFLVALDVLGNMEVLEQAAETKDDMVKEKEVDQILETLSAALDKIMGEESLSVETNSDEKEDDNIIETTTVTNESDEEDDSNEVKTTTLTPEDDSNESDADDNKSNSSEHEDNLVYVLFKHVNEDAIQPAVIEHEYSIVNSEQELKPTTSAPFMNEDDSASLSTAGAQNSINEYVEIRQDLDTQQDSLRKHEMDLDKDFYAIVSNNFDDKTLNKFEKDIYAAKDSLDKIKKNINALQNIQTKLYFHALLTNALKEAKKQSKN